MSYYVYVYHDGKIPIYVGKGKGKRAYSHLTSTPNPYFKNKLAKMRREGREPIIRIIDTPDEESAFDLEVLMIAMIGRCDLGTGTLCNLTSGGEGNSGAVRGEDYRRKMADAQRGKKHSDATKMKCSLANKGRVMSEEDKRKRSEKLKGRKMPDEIRLKMAQNRKGRKLSVETREAISKALKGKLSDAKKAALAKLHQQRVKCEHCGEETTKSSLARWHKKCRT